MDDGGAYVIVGTTLTCREYSVIYAFFEIFGILEIFPEEDQASTRTTESFVSKNIELRWEPRRQGQDYIRCGGDDIAVLERIVQLLSSYEPACMSNISHEPCSLSGCDILQCFVVPVSRVRRSTTYYQPRLEDFGLRGESGVVD